MPHNEAKRLSALRDLVILDTPPEERFDRISAFAAKEFNVPIALVSLVDQDRQWAKSSFGGLDMQESPRDISFCGHAVAMAKTLVVLDALMDPRFADNPTVVGQPYIRFYAGALLRPAHFAQVLLIEPDGLLRGTVASVCRELQMVRLQQATSIAQGEKWMKSNVDHGLLLSLAEGPVALEFLERLRAGKYRCESDIPVAVMAPSCDAALAARLKELDVRRLLLQPFRLRDVVHTLEQLWPAPEALAA